jgi:hypothetical protein
MDGIDKLKQHASLYKKFLRFIPWRPTHGYDNFITPIRKGIMAAVKYTKLIYTQSGSWVQPRQSLIVHRSLIFHDEPLFSRNELQVGMRQAFEYVDPELHQDRELLFALGCGNLDYEIVCSVISSSFPFFEKSYEWIAHLFQYLHSINESKRRYESAPFLRIATGGWTSVSEGKVYLPLSTVFDMPMGIELSVLDSRFYKEVSKSRTADQFLTTTLKLHRLSEFDLIKEIVRVHRVGQTSHGDFDFETSLNHVQYLTRCQHLIGSSEKDIRNYFKVVDHNDVLKSNKEVIVDWTFVGNNHIPQCTLSEICSDGGFSFLSPKYSSDQSKFLQSFTDVQNIATFIQETVIQRYRKRTYTTEIVSPFYTELLSPKRLGNNLLLYYLADKGINSRSFTGKNTVSEALRALEFLCESGFFSALQSCYLRTTNLEPFLTDEMNILRVESPNDHKLSFLSSLGVTSEPNLELFLHQLREHKKSISLAEREGIEDRLYRELVQFCLEKSKDLGVLE